MNQERTHTCERNIKGIFKNRNKMLLVVVFRKPTYAEALDFQSPRMQGMFVQASSGLTFLVKELAGIRPSPGDRRASFGSKIEQSSLHSEVAKRCPSIKVSVHMQDMQQKNKLQQWRCGLKRTSCCGSGDIVSSEAVNQEFIKVMSYAMYEEEK